MEIFFIVVMVIIVLTVYETSHRKSIRNFQNFLICCRTNVFRVAETPSIKDSRTSFALPKC